VGAVRRAVRRWTGGSAPTLVLCAAAIFGLPLGLLYGLYLGALHALKRLDRCLGRFVFCVVAVLWRAGIYKRSVESDELLAGQGEDNGEDGGGGGSGSGSDSGEEDHGYETTAEGTVELTLRPRTALLPENGPLSDEGGLITIDEDDEVDDDDERGGGGGGGDRRGPKKRKPRPGSLLSRLGSGSGAQPERRRGLGGFVRRLSDLVTPTATKKALAVMELGVSNQSDGDEDDKPLRFEPAVEEKKKRYNFSTR
jgi:hypothetical protein